MMSSTGGRLFYEVRGQGEPLVLVGDRDTAAAHLPNMERPEEFNQHMLEFLQR